MGNIRVQHPPDVGEQQRTGARLLRIRLQRLHDQSTNIRYLLDDAQQCGDTDAVRNFGANIDQNVRERSHLQRVRPRIKELLFKREQQNAGVKIR